MNVERRQPKFIGKSKSFLFGLAVAVLGIIEWVSSNVEFTGDHAGQIITAIGLITAVLRYFARQPVTVDPTEGK